MTKYKEIRGIHIQSVDTDPELYGGAWASGGSLNDGRYGIGSAQKATTTAGLVFGGNEGASSYTYSDKSEEYKGISW